MDGRRLRQHHRRRTNGGQTVFASDNLIRKVNIKIKRWPQPLLVELPTHLVQHIVVLELVQLAVRCAVHAWPASCVLIGVEGTISSGVASKTKISPVSAERC